ncbi:hypothetical protein WJX77_000717 [Trebouxia sp. C0004]
MLACSILLGVLNDFRISNNVTLRRNSFQLVNFPSGQDVNWESARQVKEEYYLEVAAPIKRLTGANRTHIMQHGLHGQGCEKHLSSEVAELSQKPWAIIQVWRPLTGPVQDSPGILDTATLSVDDTLAVKVHVAGGHVHEVNFLAHNPDHNSNGQHELVVRHELLQFQSAS